MDLELTDLIHLYEENKRKVSHLSLKQEQTLVSDMRLLLIAVCVRNHWNFEDIVQHYDFTRAQCVKYLLQLEKLGLIQVLPENRIKLLVAEDFRWLSKGPIETFFEETMQADFLASSFTKDSERRVFLSGSVSHASQEYLMQKLEQFAQDFAMVHRQDCKLPVQRRSHIAVVLAMRQWEFKAFKQLKKQKKD